MAGVRGRGGRRRRGAGTLLVLAAAAAGTLALAAGADAGPAGAWPPPTAEGRVQQAGEWTAGGQASCDLCHGELELLRQRTGSLQEARQLLAPEEALRGSAHGEMQCGECHLGFERFPHEGGGRTRPCASCHADADTAWSGAAHAGSGPPSTARCVDCHGVHDVRTGEEVAREPGRMNRGCVSCHATAALAEGEPHAGEAACFACHRPHRTRRVDDPGSAIARARQAETCGTCHDTVSASWREDVHGSALRADTAGGRTGRLASEEPGPPTCTTCHGAHPTHALSEGAAPAGAEVPRCADCHEEYRDTFGDSYHGQATELGSGKAASCADCHTAHSVLPASDPNSSVAESRLVETCGSCHSEARASFVEFEPHADPHDREKNPVLYWTYAFMTFLLWGVLGVFGLHTLLWLVRAAVERGSGDGAGPGGAGRGETRPGARQEES